MLLELTVENFAIIDRIHLRFAPGLNVLTGETGAGKSILIDAMSVLLGGRASEEYVRAGAERAVVTALFDPQAAPGVAQKLVEAGFEPDELIVSREITRNGRNVSRVNGRPVTLATLRQLMEGLVALHGQHEHQALLRPAYQLELLDSFGDEQVAGVRQRVAALYARVRALRQELQELAGDSRERARRVDLYRYQLAEIDAAALRPGEEEELRALRSRLAHAERIRDALRHAYALVYAAEGRDAAFEQVGEALTALTRAVEWDERLRPTVELLEAAQAHLEEAARQVRGHLEEVDVDPHAAEQVEARLSLLTNLKRKYGDTIDAILTYREHLAREIQRLEAAESRAQELETELAGTLKQLQVALEELTEARERVGRVFSEAVARELQDLGMDARLFVSVSQNEDPAGVPHRGRTVAVGPHGADVIEIQFSANPGEEPRPLHRVASGGELSRVMLALKSVLGRRDRLPTLIFDEIDAGIGGRTATSVANKLAAIAEDRQVLCVTHLPQVAAAADHHFLIEKAITPEGRTVTTVTPLDRAAREREIARMLAGEQGDVDLEHARVLLERGRRRRAG